MNTLSIIQGRLLPPLNGRIQAFPADRYAEEFPLAKEAGFEAIEWIDETYGADKNPIRTEKGVQELLLLMEKSGIRISSVCADIFMEQPLGDASPEQLAQRLDHLRLLIRHTAKINAGHILLPFVDNSSLRAVKDKKGLQETLASVLPYAEEHGVSLHLETDLPPVELQAFVAGLQHPYLKITYDSGNSAALGYNPREELAAYGERVGSLHVKDRVLGGTTVPLGTGNTHLEAVFEGLAGYSFTGPVILQVARETAGNEVEWARHNRAYVLDLLTRHGFASA